MARRGLKTYCSIGARMRQSDLIAPTSPRATKNDHEAKPEEILVGSEAPSRGEHQAVRCGNSGPIAALCRRGYGRTRGRESPKRPLDVIERTADGGLALNVRRRFVRLGQDVLPQGGEGRPRDEEGGRASHYVMETEPRAACRTEAPIGWQDRHGDRQGRRVHDIGKEHPSACAAM